MFQKYNHLLWNSMSDIDCTWTNRAIMYFGKVSIQRIAICVSWGAGFEIKST